MGVPKTQVNGRSGVETRSQNVQVQIAAATWRVQTIDSTFCQISLVLVCTYFYVTTFKTFAKKTTLAQNIFFRMLLTWSQAKRNTEHLPNSFANKVHVTVALVG